MRSRLVDKLAEHVLPPISKAGIFLTENCTMGCDYCFVAGKSASERMSWTTAQKAIDFLFAQSGDAPIIQGTFFGGEPLLEFGLMKRIAEYAEGPALADTPAPGDLLPQPVTVGTVAADNTLRLTLSYQDGPNKLTAAIEGALHGDGSASGTFNVTGGTVGTWQASRVNLSGIAHRATVDAPPPPPSL